jgi:hypothetical protein
VGLWGPEVDVENHHRHAYAEIYRQSVSIVYVCLMKRSLKLSSILRCCKNMHGKYFNHCGEDKLFSIALKNTNH